MTRSQLPVLQRALSAHEATPTSRTAAHLADAPFRFGPPEHHAQPVPRPEGPGAHWTPAETLCELRIRGAKVVETTLGLRVRHAHRLPEVAAAVRAHADTVRLWLRLGRPAPEAGWDDGVALQAAWRRERFAAPLAPVALREGVTVADWPRFVGQLEAAYAEGPTGPLADAVRRDLGDLFDRYAWVAEEPVRRPARALAA